MSNAVPQLINTAWLNRAFINGQWQTMSGTNRVDVVSPATENVICELTLGSKEDAEAAISAAKHAFEAWSCSPISTRAEILAKIEALMIERADDLAQAVSAEMGAAISYARSAHIPLAAEHIRVARENLLNYAFTEKRGTTAVVKEPIGVCALITPWNWPLYQITAKVGPALATGCTVVLKPSELTPLAAMLFAEIVKDAGVPPGVFNLINGNGEGVGSVISSHIDVDMVSITGSTRAGVLVAQAAAPTVKRVTQELGGKSANIILPDADLEKVIPLGVAGCFRNVGQSCSAPTRMLVPREKLAEAERLAVAAANDVIVDDPNSEHTTHGPIANKAQYARVQRMIDQGVAEGAKLLCGGPGRPDGLTRGFFAKPTIFSEVSPEMSIAQEEIFGPVLTMIPYDDEEEAIEIANNTVYGLSAQVQSSSLDHAHSVAAKLRCGQVLVNNPAWDPQAPFGGYKKSGTGREYGIEGLEEYLETKAIVGFYESE